VTASLPGASIDEPPAWGRLPLDELRGLLMVVGGVDVGKSTFARFLFQQVQKRGTQAAFLDGDPGQSALWPPATISLAFDLDRPPRRSWFIGSNTPQRHMLPLLTGAARLCQEAFDSGAAAVVYDTSGFIDLDAGGVALKTAKLDLLQPAALFALQRDRELEPFLAPLRRSGRVRLFELAPSLAVRPRSADIRREYRLRQFQRHFTGARVHWLDWNRLPVFPAPFFRLNRLVAFEDAHGFTLALGIVVEIDRPGKRLALLTPLERPELANALRLGDLLVDPVKFNHEQIDL
jgi:polynucleotide 5'-hydroxyl-kinase GRC3/NOL9